MVQESKQDNQGLFLRILDRIEALLYRDLTIRILSTLMDYLQTRRGWWKRRQGSTRRKSYCQGSQKHIRMSISMLRS